MGVFFLLSYYIDVVGVGVVVVGIMLLLVWVFDVFVDVFVG